MAEWDADTAIDAARAAALLARHVPMLAGLPVTPLGEGWDNAAFLVGEDWVFRFPRRAMGGELITAEVAVLGALPELGLPIPRPEHAVRAPEDYPYPFAGYRRLPGDIGDRAAPPPASRALAEAVGCFLARLHTAPLPAGLPEDTLRRADLVRRKGRVRERLLRAVELAPELPWHGVDALLAAVQAHHPPRMDCVVHGDLYPRHVLVDDGAASGVIDWGDVHRGDPCGDLAIAWSWFDAEAREALLAAYREAGPALPEAALRARARFRALQYGVVLLPYAEERGEPSLRAVAEHAVRASLLEA